MSIRFSLLFFILFLVGCSKEVTPSLELTKEEKLWLSNHKIVTLGFTTGYEPLLITHSSGDYTGLYPDIYKELEKILGIEIKIVVSDVEDIVQRLNNKSLDGVLAISDIYLNELGLRPTRTVQNLFPVIYTTTGNRKDINSLKDLNGSRIAFQSSTRVVQKALEEIDSKVLLPKNSNREAILSMLKGDAEYVVALNIQDYEIITSSIQGVRIAYYDSGEIYPFSSGIRSDWPEFVHILNKAMDILGREKVNNYLYKWINTPVVDHYLTFSSAEISWIRENAILQVAADPYWSPVEFRGEDGEYQGIAIDLLKEISIISGLEFEYIKGKTWGQLIELGKEGEVDLFSSISKTDDRDEFLDFTAPYIDIPISIFTKKDIEYVSGLRVISDKKIGVVSGFAIEEWLRRDYPNMDILAVKDAIEGLRLLEEGDIFAFVGNRVTTSWYIRQLELKTVKESGVTPYLNSQSFGVKKGDETLRQILNKSLSIINRRRVDEITNIWLDDVVNAPERNYILLWCLAGSLFLVYQILLFRYIKKLKTQVAYFLKKEELTRESDIGLKKDIRWDHQREIETNSDPNYQSENIDIPKGLELWGGMSNYIAGLQEFKRYHYSIGEDIETYLGKGEIKEAKDASNTLKLMSGNLALVKVNQLANKIELLIKSGNINGAMLLLKDLKREIEKSIRDISYISK